MTDFMSALNDRYAMLDAALEDAELRVDRMLGTIHSAVKHVCPSVTSENTLTRFSNVAYLSTLPMFRDNVNEFYESLPPVEQPIFLTCVTIAQRAHSFRDMEQATDDDWVEWMDSM